MLTTLIVVECTIPIQPTVIQRKEKFFFHESSNAMALLANCTIKAVFIVYI